ncbi:MAG: hypothetical protein AB7H97_17075 [Pseudobdellovibrionaceae bacterium]
MFSESDELVITFQGFHPSDYTRFYLDEKLSNILDEAPYGATIKAQFSRRDKTFKGYVMIHSSAGTFRAVASHSRVREVVRKLTNQLRHQLDKWKAHRFERETIRHMPIDKQSGQEVHDAQDSSVA